jgi:phage gp36-like protein
MVNYITAEDMGAAFTAAEMSDLAPADLSAALAFASRALDSAAGRWYSLPLPPVSAQAVGYLCDIARYRLYGVGAPDTVRDRNDEAHKWLAKVATGAMQLVGASGVLIDQSTKQTTLPAVGARPILFGADFSDRYNET